MVIGCWYREVSLDVSSLGANLGDSMISPLLFSTLSHCWFFLPLPEIWYSVLSALFLHPICLSDTRQFNGFFNDVHRWHCCCHTVTVWKLVLVQHKIIELTVPLLLPMDLSVLEIMWIYPYLQLMQQSCTICMTYLSHNWYSMYYCLCNLRDISCIAHICLWELRFWGFSFLVFLIRITHFYSQSTHSL